MKVSPFTNHRTGICVSFFLFAGEELLFDYRKAEYERQQERLKKEESRSQESEDRIKHFTAPVK
jgi:hypothetical protein